ncbi:MAG: hypothetical protein QOG46_990 [Pseudonocardiales bacterium]|nr:hypothetical protein [Pseudonocardiales bacterium]
MAMLKMPDCPRCSIRQRTRSRAIRSLSHAA